MNEDKMYKYIFKKLNKVNIYSLPDKHAIFLKPTTRPFSSFHWNKNSVIILQNIQKHIKQNLSQQLGREFDFYITNSPIGYWLLDERMCIREGDNYRIFVIFSDFISPN